MTHTSIILTISSLLFLIGIVILIHRQHLKNSIIEKDELDDAIKDPSRRPLVKEVILMNPNDTPDLLRVNGGIMGKKMSGAFARANAPTGAYASYNCFSILFCPVFPMGCYLINEGLKDISCYGALQSEKEELQYVLMKGWGILFIVIAILVACFGLMA